MTVDTPIFGIPEFDERIARFLPGGWLAILLGDSGSGMQLLAKQFANAGQSSSPVYYYTTYERPEDVRQAYSDYGWSADGLKITNLSEQYYTDVLDRELEISRVRERGLKYKDIAGLAPGAVPPVLTRPTARIQTDLSGIETPFRLVLDSLDFVLEMVPEAEVLTLARQLRRRCQSLGGQALLMLAADVHERRLIGLLEDLSDLLLDLRSEQSGAEFRPVLTVRKVRNHPEETRRIPLRATPGGLSVET
jgi:KaiC/GvpD/RAD55 family RecA-like ATPase